MGNVLSENKQEQVLALSRLGWSLRKIQRMTGVRRETAAVYLARAGLGRRPPREAETKPATGVTPDFGVGKQAGTAPPEGPSQAGESSASVCAPWSELIEQGLARGRNAKAIWQDLVSDHGFAGGYQSVKRFVRRVRGVRPVEARVVIETEPGQEAQVDYGEGPMVREPISGQYRRTRLFVLTLAHSRKSVRLLVFRSSAQVWAELHEKAFRRLGGVPRTIVLDNLKEGVLKPDFYDPQLNPLYRDLLKHHGAVALPCRVRDPDRKGKVESGVGHAQKTPLRGQRFESLEEAQAYLDRWEENWADTRIHGTTKRQVAAMFAEEKPTPLPLEPFRYYRYGERTVHLDGCVEVEAAYYGAPPGYIGWQVDVQWDKTHVRLIDARTGKLLREHLRQGRGAHRIAEQDRPSRTPLRTLQLLGRAENAGPYIGQLCHRLLAKQGEPEAVRRLLGVLSLAKKHGPVATDNACALALEVGVADYRFVRRYLEHAIQLPLGLRQIDPLIRELVHYRDLIEQRTREVS
jgi:transposase